MGEPRTLIIDTHVHYYSQFSPEDICRYAVNNLAAQAPDSLPGIVLVDKEDCPTYDNFVSNLSAMSDFRVESYQGHAVIIFTDHDLVHRLYVFRGAQRVVSEGFEVLCLFDSEISFDLQPADDLLMQIAILGGLAVVPWSYGKWFGKRRSALRDLCHKSRDRGHPLFLGDICQRPKFVDNLQRLAKKWGAVGVLGGSDPLPFAGDDAGIGTLGTLIMVSDDLKSLTLVSEVKNAILARSVNVVGERDSVFKGLSRWVKYSKKRMGKSDVR